MVRAYVGVGSHIDPERHVRAAVVELARAAHVAAISTFYRIDPIGRVRARPLVNGVVAIDTDRPAPELAWSVLRRIEDQLGRRRGADAGAPRTIDVALLLYGQEAYRSDRLVLPDPQIAERAFVAWPLFELDPGLVLPGGRPIRAIADRLSRTGMIALPHLTDELRRLVSDGCRIEA